MIKPVVLNPNEPQDIWTYGASKEVTEPLNSHNHDLMVLGKFTSEQLMKEITRRQQAFVDAGFLSHGEPINVSNDLIYVSDEGVKIIQSKDLKEIAQEVVEITNNFYNSERTVEIK